VTRNSDPDDNVTDSRCNEHTKSSAVVLYEVGSSITVPGPRETQCMFPLGAFLQTRIAKKSESVFDVILYPHCELSDLNHRNVCATIGSRVDMHCSQPSAPVVYEK
jgi:hypothetical protein